MADHTLRICLGTGLAMVCLAVVFLAMAPGAAHAKTLKVRNGADAGPGSLRQALAVAGNGDVIKVGRRTVKLTSGQLLIDRAVTIRGEGARRSIVRSNGSSRVFEIPPAIPAVTISGLTITGGDSGPDDGGGVRTGSSLTLRGVAITGNRTNSGGPSGGGIYSEGEELNIRHSLIARNSSYNGGGIEANGNRMNIIDTTLAGNTAGDPSANGYGGAMLLSLGSEAALLRGVTISGNRDFSQTSPGSGGGALGNFGPAVTITGSIFAGNMSFEHNGQPAGGAGNPGIAKQCTGSIIDGGSNLETGADCGFASPTSLQNTPSRLRRLGNYGGQTNTIALAPGSPAENRGAGCGRTDQRGAPRRLGGRCDIGAYELIRCGRGIVNRVGTSGGDVLAGTRRSDAILGLGGGDLLRGRGGRDFLCGGTGKDLLKGGPGRDVLIGGRGPDKLLGGPGGDLLLGGPGQDGLQGGPGRDKLRGGPGADTQRQ